MDVQEHTEQFHLHYLTSLCGIYGGRSQKKQQKQTKNTPIQYRNYAGDLKICLELWSMKTFFLLQSISHA